MGLENRTIFLHPTQVTTLRQTRSSTKLHSFIASVDNHKTWAFGCFFASRKSHISQVVFRHRLSWRCCIFVICCLSLSYFLLWLDNLIPRQFFNSLEPYYWLGLNDFSSTFSQWAFNTKTRTKRERKRENEYWISIEKCQLFNILWAMCFHDGNIWSASRILFSCTNHWVLYCLRSEMSKYVQCNTGYKWMRITLHCITWKHVHRL